MSDALDRLISTANSIKAERDRLIVERNDLCKALSMAERNNYREALSRALFALWEAHATMVDLIEAGAKANDGVRHHGSAYFCTCSAAMDYHRLLKDWQGGSDEWHPTMPGE